MKITITILVILMSLALMVFTITAVCCELANTVK